MPTYLLKPEVIRLLELVVDPIDLMRATGVRVSEVLALSKESFVFDGYDFHVELTTLKGRGRSKSAALIRSPKRFIPIYDKVLQNRVHEYLFVNLFKRGERIIKLCRQTVDRDNKVLAKKAGGAPFRISSHTFRHSFSLHLVLHGRPLKYISQLLGHRSIESTEIYTCVLTVSGSHFMEKVDFL